MEIIARPYLDECAMHGESVETEISLGGTGGAFSLSVPERNAFYGHAKDKCSEVL